MDTRTENAVEVTRQQELLRNERIITHPTFGVVKLARPTPGQEIAIAEIRRKQFQRDMADEGVLAKARLMELAEAKGMWSKALDERMHDLTIKTGEAMGLLDTIGFKSLDELTEDFREATTKLMTLFTEQPEISTLVTTYYDLDATPSAKDRATISDAATSSEVDDLLDRGDMLRTQIDLLKEMFKIRKELNDLQERYTRVFMDSQEARADRAERLATLYYCCTNPETGKYLWPSFEQIYNVRAEDIAVLTDEWTYFINGVTEEFKDTLGKYGFIRRLTDTNASFDGSPDQPQSNSDGESQPSAQTSFSGATA